jgi:hypothetical protein
MILFFQPVFSQENSFDEQSFFLKLENSYYTLTNTKTKNLKALVTSANFSKYAKNTWDNSEIFPLELIWFNPDKIYITEKGLPTSQQDYEKTMEMTVTLKRQLKGILVDLQRFYFSGIYKSIPNNYQIRNNEQAVQITYEAGEGSTYTKVKQLFGLNGLLLGIEVYHSAEKKMITVKPEFKTVKTKWLCVGWEVQTSLDGQIKNGFKLKIENRFVNDVWVPSEIGIEVQKADMPGQTFYDVISIKNYLFNQPLELK